MEIRRRYVMQDGFGDLRVLRAFEFGRARGPVRTVY